MAEVDISLSLPVALLSSWVCIVTTRVCNKGDKNPEWTCSLSACKKKPPAPFDPLFLLPDSDRFLFALLSWSFEREKRTDHYSFPPFDPPLDRDERTRRKEKDRFSIRECREKTPAAPVPVPRQGIVPPVHRPLSPYFES